MPHRLAHNRRWLVHFNITEHPTAQWTAQQVVEAFPWGAAPRYLLHGRDNSMVPTFGSVSVIWESRRS
jgi:hypothetical protein